MALSESKLAILTWGNASGADRSEGVFAIKPSGVPYPDLTPGKIVVLDIETGEKVDGDLNPSSDTPSHLELYKAFPEIGGVAHAHSPNATAFAQASRPIPCLGTTHADFFNGTIPVTRRLSEEEVAGDYERNTGLVMVETLKALELSALEAPAVLVASHGPFTWGADAGKAVEAALILEEVAKIAAATFALNPDAGDIDAYLLAKHHSRKHGGDAYYGQK
jgi:L-ribulose-5-phosphate 4-epimerase